MLISSKAHCYIVQSKKKKKKKKAEKSKIHFLLWQRNVLNRTIYLEIPKFDKYNNFINLLSKDPKEESFVPSPPERNTFDKLQPRDIFHSRMIAITRVSFPSVAGESSRIPLLFPRDYEDPLSRVYIRPPPGCKKEEGGSGRLAYLYLSQSPSPDFRAYSFFSRVS